MVERSTDDTLALARAAAASFPRVEVIDNLTQRGKGYAVRSGMLRAAYNSRLCSTWSEPWTAPLPWSAW